MKKSGIVEMVMVKFGLTILTLAHWVGSNGLAFWSFFVRTSFTLYNGNSLIPATHDMISSTSYKCFLSRSDDSPALARNSLIFVTISDYQIFHVLLYHF
jgi:hypothetical protein